MLQSAKRVLKAKSRKEVCALYRCVWFNSRSVKCYKFGYNFCNNKIGNIPAVNYRLNQNQVDILISKNPAQQILCLKHIKLHKLAIMDRNPRIFNPHKRYYTALLLYYNSKQNIPYNCPTDSQQVLNFICVI